jgi:xanthine dehydrogenase iron-sulfur cluster and FAD-binding subunit A
MYEKYFIVNSLNDAVGLKAKYSDSSKILAGGTDIMLEMERGLHTGVKQIIDISRVSGLDEIWMDDQLYIHIGPTATHSACLKSSLIQDYAKCLYQACQQVGSPQIRNRGTVAGNIATASPANDTISALMALDAKVELLSSTNKRIIEISKFFNGVRKTALLPNEIISDISFKALKKSERSWFIKVGLRNAQAISILNCAVVLGLNDKTIVKSRIALGAVGATVFRAIAAEESLINQVASETLFENAAQLAGNAASPINDIRASGEYRHKMIFVHVKRALQQAVESEDLVLASPVVLWGKENSSNAPLTENSIEFDDKSVINVMINSKEYTLEGGFQKNLLDLIRENALLTGSKEGCGEGECGACTVYMDGVAVLACLIPAVRAHNSRITTIEGINSNGELHKVQQSFIDEGAVQCGYCTPGFVMSAVKLLEEKPNPSIEEIKTGISGNLCRCTGYYKIISAIELAAKG